ncbi:MAG: O-antigen ligase family protein [Candidatus Edwardsbacteria bacterium]
MNHFEMRQVSLRKIPYIFYFHLLLMMGIVFSLFGSSASIYPLCAYLLILYSVFFLSSPHFALLSLGIFMLFAPTLLNMSIMRVIPLGSLYSLISSVDELLIAWSATLSIGTRIIKREQIYRTPIDLPILGLIGAGLVSSLLHHVPMKIMTFGTVLMLKGFVVFYLFSQLDHTERHLQRYLRVIFVLAIVLYVFAIIELLFPSQFYASIRRDIWLRYRAGLPVVQSLLSNYALFGWFTSFIGLFAVAFYYFSKNKKYLWIAGAFLLATIFSMSRKSIVGMLLAVILSFLFLPQEIKKKTVFSLAGVMGLLGLFLGANIIIAINTLLQESIFTPFPTTSARLVLYVVGLKIALVHFPFGVGLGRYGGWISVLYYSPVYREYGLNMIYGLGDVWKQGQWTFIADTFWPHIMGETGFLGLACYVLIIFRLFSLCRSGISEIYSLYPRVFILAAMLILIEALSESTAMIVFENPPLYYFIFASLGIATSLYRKYHHLQLEM